MSPRNPSIEELLRVTPARDSSLAERLRERFERDLVERAQRGIGEAATWVDHSEGDAAILELVLDQQRRTLEQRYRERVDTWGADRQERGAELWALVDGHLRGPRRHDSVELARIEAEAIAYDFEQQARELWAMTAPHHSDRRAWLVANLRSPKCRVQSRHGAQVHFSGWGPANYICEGTLEIGEPRPTITRFRCELPRIKDFPALPAITRETPDTDAALALARQCQEALRMFVGDALRVDPTSGNLRPQEWARIGDRLGRTLGVNPVTLYGDRGVRVVWRGYQATLTWQQSTLHIAVSEAP